MSDDGPKRYARPPEVTAADLALKANQSDLDATNSEVGYKLDSRSVVSIAYFGSVKLVAGSATVAVAGVSDGSPALLSIKEVGGTTGLLSYVISGEVLTISSLSALDTSTVVYLIKQT